MNQQSRTEKPQVSTKDDAAYQDHLRRMVEYYARTGHQYNTWHCDRANNSSHNFAVREIIRTMQEIADAQERLSQHRLLHHVTTAAGFQHNHRGGS